MKIYLSQFFQLSEVNELTHKKTFDIDESGKEVVIADEARRNFDEKNKLRCNPDNFLKDIIEPILNCINEQDELEKEIIESNWTNNFKKDIIDIGSSKCKIEKNNQETSISGPSKCPSITELLTKNKLEQDFSKEPAFRSLPQKEYYYYNSNFDLCYNQNYVAYFQVEAIKIFFKSVLTNNIKGYATEGIRKFYKDDIPPTLSLKKILELKENEKISDLFSRETHFLNNVAKNININILTPKDEGEYEAISIKEKKKISTDFILISMGGNSTQVVKYDSKKEIYIKESFPIGKGLWTNKNGDGERNNLLGIKENMIEQIKILLPAVSDMGKVGGFKLYSSKRKSNLSKRKSNFSKKKEK